MIFGVPGGPKEPLDFIGLWIQGVLDLIHLIVPAEGRLSEPAAVGKFRIGTVSKTRQMSLPKCFRFSLNNQSQKFWRSVRKKKQATGTIVAFFRRIWWVACHHIPQISRMSRLNSNIFLCDTRWHRNRLARDHWWHLNFVSFEKIWCHVMTPKSPC